MISNTSTINKITTAIMYSIIGAFLFVLFWSSNKGFDFSDEAYYYIDLNNNLNNNFRISYFHNIITHLLPAKIMSNVIYNRIFRIILSIIISYLTTITIRKYLFKEIKIIYLFSIVLISVFHSYSLGSMSLSYNTLSLFSILLFFNCFCILLFEQENTRKINFTYLGIGILICALTFTKITNAFFCLFIVMIFMAYDFYKNKKTINTITQLVLIAFGFFIYLFFVFDFDINYALSRYHWISYSIENYPPEYKLQDLLMLYFDDSINTLITITKNYYLSITFFILALLFKKNNIKYLFFLIALVLIALIGISNNYLVGGTKGVYTLNQFIILITIYSVIIHLFFLLKKIPTKINILCLILLLLPIFGSFGTNNYLSVQITLYIVFYLIYNTYIFNIYFKEKIKLFSILFLLLEFYIVATALIFNGYRITELSSCNFTIDINENKTKSLLVDAKTKYSIYSCYNILKTKTNIENFNNQNFMMFFHEAGFVYFFNGEIPGGDFYSELDKYQDAMLVHFKLGDIERYKNSIFITPKKYKFGEEIKKELYNRGFNLDDLVIIGEFVFFNHDKEVGPKIMQIKVPKNLVK